jgi:nucleoside-diphosphate-sugar epimerase
MKRVIITGPTGAIGIALIQHLIDNKVEVYAVCRKGSR